MDARKFWKLFNWITFTGNSVGIEGNSYPNSASDIIDPCFKPGGGESCSGITSISSSDTHGTNMHSALSSASTNLSTYTSTLLTLSSIDVTDTDITN